MSTDTGERALWPKPAVNQSWVDMEGDVIRIIDVDTEGSYPVKFMWDSGDIGRIERDMHGFEPTAETWTAHILSTDAELRRVEGERDEAREALAVVREQALREAALRLYVRASNYEKEEMPREGHAARMCAQDMERLAEITRLSGEVAALRGDRDKYKQRLSDNQEKFAWAKSQKAERVRLQAMLDTARRSSCDIIEDLRAELAQAKDLLRPLTGSTWDDDIDAYHLAAMRAFLATTTPVPPGARGLGTSALIQGATREPFIAARGASGSSTGPGSPKQGFFTPAQRLLPCLDCGKASGANSEHDWHHPFNPGVERGVPGPGEGSK